MSELAVKPWRTIRAPGADRPQLRDLTHQRQTCSLVQNRISLRTVRALGADCPQFTFQPKPEKQPLWYKSEITRRTVCAPWADCPPFNFEAHQRDTLSGTNLRRSGGPSAHLGRTVREPTRAFASSLERARTVLPSGADCPPLLSQLSNLVFFKSFQSVVSPHACN